MQAVLLAGWMAWSVLLPPIQIPTETMLGPKAFHDGDVIEITDVRATSVRLEQGDSVTVSGRFQLQSHDDAHLSLYLTATEGDGRSGVDKSQTMHVDKGTGKFELKTTIRNRGVLHLTFYDARSGRPFGGVYFGTPSQMKSIEDWDLGYYFREDD